MNYNRNLSEKQLISYKARLTKFVNEAVKNAHKKGWKLKRDTWLSMPDEGKQNGTVCAVGAIGVLLKPPESKRAWASTSFDFDFDMSPNPYNVAPLIKNGTATCVDDEVLYCLSDGFEGNGFGSSSHAAGSSTGRLKEYLRFAHALGKKVWKTRPLKRGK